MKFRITLFLIFAIGAVAAQNVYTKKEDAFSLNAPQLNSKKNIVVYLPKKYESNAKRYPVLYMVNGKNILGSRTNMEETLFNTKAMAIVVEIDHDAEFASLNEMDRFLDFVALELKPHIDKTYRTQTDSADTGLLGAGTAGLMAFYGSIKYPQTFGRIGCFSPASVKYWQEIVNIMAKTADFRLTHIYFLHGENAVEASAYIEHWVNTKRCSCKKRNKRVYVKDRPDNPELWRDGFKKAYLWLF